jgi:hypothetical protein
MNGNLLKWADEQVPEELGSALRCQLLLFPVSLGLHAEGFAVKNLIIVLHVNGFVHSPVAWRIGHRILNAVRAHVFPANGGRPSANLLHLDKEMP